MVYNLAPVKPKKSQTQFLANQSLTEPNRIIIFNFSPRLEFQKKTGLLKFTTQNQGVCGGGLRSLLHARILFCLFFAVFFFLSHSLSNMHPPTYRTPHTALLQDRMRSFTSASWLRRSSASALPCVCVCVCARARSVCVCACVRAAIK